MLLCGRRFFRPVSIFVKENDFFVIPTNTRTGSVQTQTHTPLDLEIYGNVGFPITRLVGKGYPIKMRCKHVSSKNRLETREQIDCAKYDFTCSDSAYPSHKYFNLLACDVTDYFSCPLENSYTLDAIFVAMRVKNKINR